MQHGAPQFLQLFVACNHWLKKNNILNYTPLPNRTNTKCNYPSWISKNLQIFLPLQSVYVINQRKHKYFMQKKYELKIAYRHWTRSSASNQYRLYPGEPKPNVKSRSCFASLKSGISFLIIIIRLYPDTDSKKYLKRYLLRSWDSSVWLLVFFVVGLLCLTLCLRCYVFSSIKSLNLYLVCIPTLMKLMNLMLIYTSCVVLLMKQLYLHEFRTQPDKPH